MFRMKLMAAGIVAIVGWATPLPAQTQPAAPPQPAVTQPTPQIPPDAQPQTPAAMAQPPARPAVPPATVAPLQSPTVTAPLSESPHGTAILLLDRIQQVLDKAVDGKSEQISLDRGLLDEVRAEITQVKLTLQSEKR